MKVTEVLAMFNQKILKERDELIQKVRLLDEKIKKFPKGELLCVRNGKYIKWFQSNGTTPIYIPKKKQVFAEKLAAKKLCLQQRKEYQQEIHLLSKCLDGYKKLNNKSVNLLSDKSAYNPLLKSYFQTFPNELQQWMTCEYEGNEKYPENLIHKTLSGHNVRSKSEVIIANALFLIKIPYRYECGIRLDDVSFFPDFTICHPKTLQIFYWEHFGMMDDQVYCEKTYNKLRVYARYDIIPTINLITTYETLENPIDSEKVQRLIEEFFL